jgi:hypothetical protein
MSEFRLHRADGAPDGAVTDRLALELGRYREDEGIAIERAQRGNCGAHGRARGCAGEIRAMVDTP